MSIRTTDWKHDGVRVIPANQLDTNTAQTPGMNRAAAINFARVGAQKLWAGTVTIHANAKTGAHHHGHLESVIYVVRGRARMRWGEQLEFTAEAGPGDFIYVPPYVPHQEINASATEALECVLCRSDGEAVAINLDIEPVEKPETVLWVDPTHPHGGCSDIRAAALWRIARKRDQHLRCEQTSGTAYAVSKCSISEVSMDSRSLVPTSVRHCSLADRQPAQRVPAAGRRAQARQAARSRTRTPAHAPTSACSSAAPSASRSSPAACREMASLYAQLPNFTEVLDDVRRHVALAQDSRDGLEVTPMLLLGPPGIGKTHFARKLAELLGTGMSLVPMNSMTAGWLLSGASSQWKGAKPGKVFEALVDGQYANPVIVVDEIDKAGADAQYDPLGALYNLLEHDTAQSFVDEFAEVAIDASQVIWITTANDERAIPEPIRNRMNVFEIEAPSPEAARQIARNLYISIRAEHDWGRLLAPEPADDVLDLWPPWRRATCAAR